MVETKPKDISQVSEGELNLDLIHARQITDFQDDPDFEDIHHEINIERTRELQAMPKYKKFREWCDNNGVFNPSVEYPVAFGKHGHLVGMCAARDIPPMTAFLYIPWHLLITDENLKKLTPELNTIFGRHPALFKRHQEAEYFRMILFLWYERVKGEKSFWKPYLDIINFTDLPCLWSNEELALLQDVVLISNI